jgi:prepilin-type N-terminal cleavage/methylation domain-containing protein
MIRNQRGFTLAELLIVVAILGFMMGALFTLQRSGQVAYMVGAARVEVQQNARLALDLMMTEIRSARAITEPVANCTLGTNDITITDQNDNIVRYQLVGTELQRTVNGVMNPVIGGVSALRISCFDLNNTPTTGAAAPALPAIRTITVSVTTQTERAAAANSPGNQHAIVEGRVRLRNIL